MREGEVAVNGEAGVDTCTRPRVKQPASGRLLRHAGSPARSPGMARGWDGVAGGRLRAEGICVCTQLIHTVGQQELTQHCQAVMYQLQKGKLQQKSLKKKKRFLSFTIIVLALDILMGGCGGGWGGQWEGLGRKSPL